MDEILYAMPNADLKVLAAIMQATCANEIAMEEILKQNGVALESSGLRELRDMVFKELGRRNRHDK